MISEDIIFSVTRNGRPLDPRLYTWDEETRTFSTTENGLVLDFTSVCYCTFNTGAGCTFITGSSCTFNTWYGCTFNTGAGCTFITWYGCIFNTGDGCIFNTGDGCTFNTGSGCTFITGDGCIFNTEDGCIFNTGSGCTFNTWYGCTFNTGAGCVIIRRDEFEVIQPLENEVIKLCPYAIKGYISKRDNEDAFYKDIDGERVEHIIADGILSKVVKKRGNVYHVVNHGEDEISFIVTDGENFSHGATLEEAKNDLKYKLSSRDTSAYKDLNLKSVLTLEEAIKMYRTITGACESGTKYFVEQVLKTPKEIYTVSEVIELTKGCWNHDLLVKFFDGKGGLRAEAGGLGEVRDRNAV